MIGNNLKHLRSEHMVRGISQAHLARKIGVSTSFICKLECGERKPSFSIWHKLADYFGCRLEDVFYTVSDEQ